MIKVSRRGALVGLASVLASPHRVIAANASGPPLWVAERRSSKVYFFGQMPVPMDAVWLSGTVQKAFDSSSEFWTENPDPMEAGDFKPPPSTGPKLSEVITPAEMSRLRVLLAREGLAAAALDETLLADAYPVVAWLQDHSIEADFSVFPERVLRSRAKAAGKAVRSEWTSFEELVRFRSRLSTAQRQQMDLELVRRGMDEAERVEEARQQLTGWMAGDLSALDAMAERNRQRYPLIEKLIGADRNKAWVGRTSSIMRRTQTAFVCVGIGHLLGPSSIQSYLNEDGLQVRRV